MSPHPNRVALAGAVAVALRQAIAAGAVTAIAAIAAIISQSNVSVVGAIEAQRYWLDVLSRLTFADLAVLLAVLALSLDKLVAASPQIVRSTRPTIPGKEMTELGRTTTLCLLSTLICLLGLVFPPSWIRVMVQQGGSVALVAFLWPTLLTTLTGFFVGGLIGSCYSRRRG